MLFHKFLFNKFDLFFVWLLLTNHETLSNIKIVYIYGYVATLWRLPPKDNRERRKLSDMTTIYIF